MHLKKRLILIVFMAMIFFSLCINYTYSQLSPMKRRELMIAYMNGYYQALQLDVEEIKKLQNDKDILKRKVKAAGGKYTNLIDIMNPSKFGDAEGYRGYNERETSGEGNPKF